jgi:hypothetical protein
VNRRPGEQQARGAVALGHRMKGQEGWRPRRAWDNDRVWINKFICIFIVHLDKKKICSYGIWTLS